MKLKSLANWAEIVGAIAVVVPLFYVGYQVRQNTDAVQAETLNRTTEGLSDLFEQSLDRETAELIVQMRGSLNPYRRLMKNEPLAFSPKT